MKTKLLWIALASAMVAAGLSPNAQTPQAPAPAGAPPADDAAAGRGGRRGGQAGRGGPNGNDLTFRGPVMPVTAAEQQKTFSLPEGFKMEPVVTEPHVQEPGQIAFDGNGRMFVVELRGYMQDLDATGQLDTSGVISIHEDKNNDGTYETHGVFVDKLVLPRWVMPFGAHSVLVNESNGDEVWQFTDTNRDGVADKKDLFATGFGRLTNVELQQSGLTWALDNWMYSTVNQFRVRWTPKGVIREATGKNGGQWGLTQDNYGKLYFQAGGSGMPAYFQLPVLYGAFANPEEFEPGLTTIWGAPVLVGDFAGATNARFPEGSLINATAAAGNDIFRGDRLPKDLIGDLLYGETAGRVIRRLRPVNMEGMTQLRNVYPQSEFVKSTDPLFRPVDVTTAPDGTAYITDMYRGVIEELQWNQPGSYIRNRIQQLQMEKVIRKGRIWRLSHASMARDAQQPRMLNESAAQLVTRLGHPNGWWRDTAQQLLVLKQDKSVVPALRRMVASGDQLGRIHALWTLEGLDSLEPALVRSLIKDPDTQVRIQAIRASETLYKAGDRSFAADYKAAAADPNHDVAIQGIMTLNLLKVGDAPQVIRATMAANKAKGVQIVGTALLDPSANQYVGRGAAAGVGNVAPLSAEEQSIMTRGRTIYSETCFACHADDGRGAVAPGGAAGAMRAPSLAGSPRLIGHRDYALYALLHGLTGPVDGERYEDVMIPMGMNPDQWIADVASYARNSWGNRASFVTAADVARVRAATSARRTPWTVDEITARLPRPLVVDDRWKFSASHNSASARNALSLQPWTTGEPQKSGMWFQVELPAPVMLTEIQFDSQGAGRGGGGGGGGGRAAAAGRGAPTDGRGAAAPAAPAARGPVLTAPGSPTTGGFALTGAYPRGYRVAVSMDGTTWSAPVAQGAGTGRSTVIGFAPVRAKFVRITQTADAENAPPWAIMLMKLYEGGR